MKFFDLAEAAEENDTDFSEDGKTGEVLLEEILRSFERFDRELGELISEYLPSDQK
ncbi:hypothetical protein [Leptospira gomenensis]|nr:hypothetical protein [Leptospira gomenensis]